MVANVLRQVGLTDDQPDQPDASGITRLRARRWRWDGKLPSRPGSYAMRRLDDPGRRCVIEITRAHIAELQSGGTIPSWLLSVQFSNQPLRWPLEPSVDDEDDEYVAYERPTDHVEYVYEELMAASTATKFWHYFAGLLSGIVLTGAIILITRVGHL